MAGQGVHVVTGAAGHLGNVLVRGLLARGARVRAMVLPGECVRSLEGLDVERVEGDVRDLEGVKRVFAGAERVYHLAGLISIMPGDEGRLHAVNVEGTRHVVAACEACGVARLVYVSSVHALVEPPHGKVITESAGFEASRLVGGYGQSKALATEAVMAGVGRGLDAVVVFPSGIVGPYDFNESEMGHVVLDYLRGRLWAYVEGGYNFVDVRDVAAGIMAAGDRGRKGEGYILSGEYLTISEFMEKMHGITGLPVPGVKFPLWVAEVAAWFMPLLARVRGKKPRFTRYSLYVLRSNGLMDCGKARRELGYAPRPLEVGLRDAVRWFREAGLAPK